MDLASTGVASAPALIDERGLDVLDFQRVRERYAGQTHAPRSYARALACEPATDFALVRMLVGETGEMRVLAREGFAMARVDDVEEAVQIAARGVALPARDLRAIADALARPRRRGARDPRVRGRAAAAAGALRRLPRAAQPGRPHHRRDRRARQRARPRLAGAGAHPARHAAGPGRRARPGRRDRALVALRQRDPGRDRHRARRALRRAGQGRVRRARSPASCTTRSSSGQTLFVEPLETLEANNRLRALQVQEQAEIARILAELSALVGGEAAQIAADVEVYLDLDLAAARARDRRPHGRRRPDAGRRGRGGDPRRPPPAARRARGAAVGSARRRDAAS